MRALIVSAHPPGSCIGTAVFGEFEASVRGALATTGEQVDVTVTRLGDLDRYLFVSPANTGLSGLPESLKASLDDPLALLLFDRLDFVFLDGPHTTPPWAPRAHKAFILVQQCFLTGKALFGSAFLAHMLVYMAATGGVFRRVGWADTLGGKLEQLKHLAPSRTLYFHNETGDVYARQPVDPRYAESSSQVWRPIFNVGLRAHSSRNRSNIRYTPRIPSSKGKFAVSVDPSVRNVTSRINVQFQNHWAFRGITSNQLMVPSRHSWDICLSPLAPVQIDILAANDWSPTLLEYGHILAAKFDITPKSESSLAVLHNFVTAKYELMRKVSHIEYISQLAFQKTLEEGSSLALARKLHPHAGRLPARSSLLSMAPSESALGSEPGLPPLTPASDEVSVGALSVDGGPEASRWRRIEAERALAGGGAAMSMFIAACDAPFTSSSAKWQAAPSTTLEQPVGPPTLDLPGDPDALLTDTRASRTRASRHPPRPPRPPSHRRSAATGSPRATRSFRARPSRARPSRTARASDLGSDASSSSPSLPTTASSTTMTTRRRKWRSSNPYARSGLEPVRVVRVNPKRTRPYSSWRAFRGAASSDDAVLEVASYRFPESDLPLP